MQIGNLTYLAPNAQPFNSAAGLNSSRASTATTALPEVARPGVSAASSSAPARSPAPLNQASANPAPSRTAGGGDVHIHAAPVQSVSDAAIASEVTSISAYATTVSGKQYAGNVEDAGGEYTASIPSVALATATGSSAAAAEDNLDVRIDELV